MPSHPTFICVHRWLNLLSHPVHACLNDFPCSMFSSPILHFSVSPRRRFAVSPRLRVLFFLSFRFLIFVRQPRKNRIYGIRTTRRVFSIQPSAVSHALGRPASGGQSALLLLHPYSHTAFIKYPASSIKKLRRHLRLRKLKKQFHRLLFLIV